MAERAQRARVVPRAMAISHRATITETSAEVPHEGVGCLLHGTTASSPRPADASARAYARNVAARSATEMGAFHCFWLRAQVLGLPRGQLTPSRQRHGRLELAERPRGVALGGAAVGGDHGVRRGFANRKVAARRRAHAPSRARPRPGAHARASRCASPCASSTRSSACAVRARGVEDCCREARAHQVPSNTDAATRGGTGPPGSVTLVRTFGLGGRCPGRRHRVRRRVRHPRGFRHHRRRRPAR